MHYRSEMNERVCSHRHRKAKEAKWCTEVGYTHDGARVVECIGDQSSLVELRRIHTECCATDEARRSAEESRRG